MTEPRDPKDRLPPPPIEPLPDLAWARLERVVLAELDVPETRSIKIPLSKWLVALASAAFAGAAALTIVIATRDDSTAPRTPVATESRGGAPSRVVTGDAATDVSFGDAHITVAPASAVVFDGAADHGVLAVLERGSASFVVAPRRERPPFVIQAGAVGVRVVGTEFSVTRIGTDDAEVVVTEGTVEITHHGRVVDVTRGERWTSVPQVTASTQPDPAALAAAPAPVPAPDRVRKPDPSDKPDKATKPDGPSAQQRFEAAARLEASDPDAANEAYREIARGKGAWAGNALYAMGRLAYDRGKRDTARAYLKIYVHRFPKGANVADARALLVKLDEGAKEIR